MKVNKDIKIPRNNINASTSQSIVKFTAKNIDFFDSAVESEDNLVNIEKYVIYKNIYEFKDRIDTLVQV